MREQIKNKERTGLPDAMTPDYYLLDWFAFVEFYSNNDQEIEFGPDGAKW